VHNKTDYAANAGDRMDPNYYPSEGPASLADGDGASSTPFAWPSWITTMTGITYMHSKVKPADISDGLSHTIAVGEKYLDPDDYENGLGGGDNNSLFQGNDWDTVRWVYNTEWIGFDPMYFTPTMDAMGAPLRERFGSTHAGAAQFALCDGSVRAISYEIDPETFHGLGNRKDGKLIDANSY
jgi:prepilin-type processing-associated H-X9-DG protein